MSKYSLQRKIAGAASIIGLVVALGCVVGLFFCFLAESYDYAIVWIKYICFGFALFTTGLFMEVFIDVAINIQSIAKGRSE